MQTSLAKAAHHPYMYTCIAQIPDFESQHDDADSQNQESGQGGDDIQITTKIIINCSLYHRTAILKISSKSAHNLLGNGRTFQLDSQHGNPDHY